MMEEALDMVETLLNTLWDACGECPDCDDSDDADEPLCFVCETRNETVEYLVKNGREPYNWKGWDE